MFLLQSIYLDEPVSKKSASVELEEVKYSLVNFFLIIVCFADIFVR